MTLVRGSEKTGNTAMRDPKHALLGEVARALDISRSTAWVRVLRGDIPATNVGGRFVVERRVLRRLVARRNRETNKQAAPAAVA